MKENSSTEPRLNDQISACCRPPADPHGKLGVVSTLVVSLPSHKPGI